VGKLTAGSLQTDSYVQSSNYVAGAQGFRISANGNVEFQSAVVRGTVYATDGEFSGTVKADTTILGGAATTYASGSGFYGSVVESVYKWRVGEPEGARIQWDGTAVEVYNSSNILTLSSGGVSWDSIVSKPTFGIFATAPKLTADNVSTYIADVAIKSALIADAAISTAKIGDLQVNTLKIANDSVSVASSYTSTQSGGTTTYTVNYSMAYDGAIIAQIVAIPLGTWYNGYYAGSIFYWDDLSNANSYSNTSYYYSGAPMIISFEKSVSAGANSFQARLQQVGTYTNAGCTFYITLLRRYR
jgi:hypothetical protein